MLSHYDIRRKIMSRPTERTGVSRRDFLAASMVTAVAAQGVLIQAADASADISADDSAGDLLNPPSVLHQTDLFHPHGDPDDHFDLATLFALHKRDDLCAAGLILDYPPEHRRGDPAVAAVAQMNRFCASAVPAVVGAKPQMKALGDSMPELPFEETAAIQFILDRLAQATEKTAITCVGSATDIAVASLRNPELFRDKCAAVLLDAGAAFADPDHPETLEWNVRLNPLAYATLFSLPCPLKWYPCWDIVERRVSGEWGTFYWLEHAEAFDGISDRLKNFFAYMFEETASPLWLKKLDEKIDDNRWGKILADKRGMWSTASLLDAANLAVTRDGDIAAVGEIAPADTLYRMENVAVTCSADGRTEWKESSEPTGVTMFHLLAPELYPAAMTRAVHTLLKEF